MTTSSTRTSHGQPRAARRGPGPRWLWVVAVGLVALVAIVAYALTRPAKSWDRTTPEGTVQAYVTALLNGDTVTAASLLAADSPCSATDLDRTTVPRETAVDLVGTTVQTTPTGKQAQVRVRVTFDAGAQPLGDSGEERTFRLTMTGAGWRIDGIPWPLYDCSGG